MYRRTFSKVLIWGIIVVLIGACFILSSVGDEPPEEERNKC